MSTEWCVPCLRGVFGDWVYYAALMSAADLSVRVMSAKNIREAEALDDRLQRDLKPRVKKITAYLNKRSDRFFGSIILGVFGGLPDWVELDLSAVGEKLPVAATEVIEESLGLLVFRGGERVIVKCCGRA